MVDVHKQVKSETHIQYVEDDEHEDDDDYHWYTNSESRLVWAKGVFANHGFKGDHRSRRRWRCKLEMTEKNS